MICGVVVVGGGVQRVTSDMCVCGGGGGGGGGGCPVRSYVKSYITVPSGHYVTHVDRLPKFDMLYLLTFQPKLTAQLQ